MTLDARAPAAEIEAVSFDVTSTLLHAPRLGEIYAEVLVRHGHPVSEADVLRLAPVVWQELGCSVPTGGDRFGASPEGARGFWLRYLRRLCALLDAGEPTRFAAAELFDRFGRADAWTIYPDVMPALAALHAAGVRMAVVSNWDERLPRLLERVGLRPFFETVVHSSAVRCEKPGAAIFREAARRLGVAPEALLHVGDHAREDVEGARAVGMQALLLDRAGGGELASLGELPARLGRAARGARP